MYLRVKILCLNILIIVCSITSIQGSCRIIFPNSNSLRPTIYKNVGSHKIKINHNSFPFVELYDDREIEAQCVTNFELPEGYESSNKLYIRCNYYTYIKSDDLTSETQHSSEITLQCSSKMWNMYESVNKFTWCPTNVTSYILARKKHMNLGHDYLAGICYDIHQPSLSSVYYTLAPTNLEYMQPSVLENLYRPSLEINYIEETFGANSITENDFDNTQFKTWINDTNYEFSSIIQNPKISSSFNPQYSSIIEFVWWPNLRHYNWRHYETALEQHVETDNQAYDILAGVSGAIKAPIIDNCQTNYTLKEVVDKTGRRIPLYVWNYLQARDNSSNEIVIIGFNSPFNEFYSEEEIIFCPDKCQQVPWLNKVSSTFRYRIMGIMFCCNVEDVQSSNRLNGFPENIMNLIPAKTTFTYRATVSNHIIGDQNLEDANDKNSDEFINDYD